MTRRACSDCKSAPALRAGGGHLRRDLVARLRLACLAGLLVAGATMRTAAAGEVREGEALVMRLVFDECLGYLRHGRTPFQGLPSRPAPEAVKRQFPAAMPDRNQIVELLSPRYAAAWGADGTARHCIVQPVPGSGPSPDPGLLGVRPEGFIGRMTARAAAAGIDRHPAAGEDFSPLQITTWSEPETGHDTGPLRPIRIVVMPTDRSDDGSLLDAGRIVMSGPP